MHNRIRDSVYLVMNHLAPYAHLVSSEADVALEPSGLLLPYPNCRPADVLLRLLPGAIPQASHLLIDVTTIPMPMAAIATTGNFPDLSTPLSVSKVHQKYENEKFRGTRAAGVARDLVTRELRCHGYLLLPATIDPGGQLGPLLTHFLWQAGRRPLPGLPWRFGDFYDKVSSMKYKINALLPPCA